VVLPYPRLTTLYDHYTTINVVHTFFQVTYNKPYSLATYLDLAWSSLSHTYTLTRKPKIHLKYLQNFDKTTYCKYKYV
jgi:hypothetical protein